MARDSGRRLEAVSYASGRARLIDRLPNTHARYVDEDPPREAGDLLPEQALVVGTIVEVRYGQGFQDAADESGPVVVDPAEATYYSLLLTIERDEDFGDMPGDGAFSSGLLVPGGLDLQRIVNGLHAIGPALLAVTSWSNVFPEDVWALAANAELISPLGGDDQPFAFPALSDAVREALIRDSPTLAALREQAAAPVRYRNVRSTPNGGWTFADEPTTSDTVPTG